MSETVTLSLSFEPTRASWLRLGAAGAVLVAAILASVVLGLGWASYDTSVSGNGMSFEERGDYQLFKVQGDRQSAKYTASGLDDADGIGLLRAAGPLAIVGVVLGYVAAVVLAVAAFVRAFRLDLVAGAIASLAALFLILVVVLFPIGVAQFHQEGTQQVNGFTFETTALAWGAGLVLGIVATVLALAAGAAAWLSLRSEGLPQT